MSHYNHHAIIVIGNHIMNDDGITPVSRAHVAAEVLGLATTNIVLSDLNGFASFMVVPDGSKENRPESDEGDAARDKFIDWVRATDSVHYAEVAIGPDDDTAEVTRWSVVGANEYV